MNTLIGPILPILSSKWHLSDAQAGHLFTAQFASAIAGSALSGLLIRKLGVITVLAAGYGGLAIAIASLSANSWLIGLASFVMLGFSLGCRMAPGTSHPAMSRQRRANVGGCGSRSVVRASSGSDPEPLAAISQQR